MVADQQEIKLIFDRAVIIGGGIAGLLAARVLSDYFSEVLILERGYYPDGPFFRKETPQARHRHGISEQGRRVFAKLFPDLDSSLEKAGCPSITPFQKDMDYDVDYKTIRATDVAHINQNLLKSRVVSRPRIEWAFRMQIAGIKNVKFIQGCRVKGLIYSPIKQHVEGVNALIDGDTQLQQIHGGLIIDASGRHSKINTWLKENELQLPEESVVDSTLLMVGCQYEKPKDFSPDWITLFIQSRSPYNFGEAFLTIIEDNYLQLTTSGLRGHYPPTKNSELLDFLKNLRKSGIYNIVKELKPLGSAYGYGHTQNRRRHFEQLPDFPDRFIVIGDAACCFSPAYGFGMGVAGETAETLQEVLNEQQQIGSLHKISHRFHKALAKTVEATWQNTTSNDQVYLSHTKLFSALKVPDKLPLKTEPHISAWQKYAQQAGRLGGLTALKQRFAQLHFPICANISKTKAYKDSTLRGLPVDFLMKDKFVLCQPANLTLNVYEGVGGTTPIIETTNRADFEQLVQALAKRNEPANIPKSDNLYIVTGFNNWDRIQTYKKSWMKSQEPDQLNENSLGNAWQSEFRRLRTKKHLYQDSFVISENRIQVIAGHAFGVSDAKWLELSDIIHNEYVATHYFLNRIGFARRNAPIHNELIAYYVGLVMALGEFKREWFFKLLNPHFVIKDKSLVMCVAENMESFEQKHGECLRNDAGVGLMIYVLDSLTIADLSAVNGVLQLERALNHWHCAI